MINNAINLPINSFITNNDLLGASNTNSPSALALKNYIDSSIISGNVLQLHTTTRTDGATSTSTIPSDNTIPQQSEGTEFFTVSITPISTTSRLFVRVFLSNCGSNVGAMVGALFRDATANAFGAAFGHIGGAHQYALNADIPSISTTSTTIKFRFGRSGTTGTAYCNRVSAGVLFSSANIASLTVTEIEL